VTAVIDQVFPGFVAESQAMREVLQLVFRLAEARSPVLLEGESGTGKDLLVHGLHYGGPRRNGPLIKIHCPSIPEDLLESELFGHEKGAFTDAQQGKIGKIEMAQGGTLYFDQIHDLVPSLQAKLLRVAEERRFERLGGTKTIEVDLRIVSSSSVDLRRAVAAGTFRDDLYHRLSVVPVDVPPLRSRREDIVPLAVMFLARERERRTTVAQSLAQDAKETLLGYRWPGNVRELRSVLERAALYAQGTEISAQALPDYLREEPSTLWAGRDRRPSLKDVEQGYIRFVLEQVRGSQTRAAQILGISRKALWEKRRRYRIP
jgi:transcriptional regulator with PAS, ATPase and Fis domain